MSDGLSYFYSARNRLENLLNEINNNNINIHSEKYDEMVHLKNTLNAVLQDLKLCEYAVKTYDESIYVFGQDDVLGHAEYDMELNEEQLKLVKDNMRIAEKAFESGMGEIQWDTIEIGIEQILEDNGYKHRDGAWVKE